MIPEETIQTIRERVEIAVLVGEYVRLKKIGVSFKGLCPFHNEKTPSFHVHPQRGFFHCFGCKASGDVFKFLMQIEGLSFPEAAQRLAERAGVELPDSDPQRDAEHRRKRQKEDRLTSLVEAAAGFFIRQMSEHAHGPMARDAYLEREITPQTAETFRLGYAPAAWGELTAFLGSSGYSPGDAELVGLIVPKKSGSGHYDRFRHRLMFPIADHQGRIVAFSGRILDPPPTAERGQEPGAKYINSPEGPLYKKGKILFGLYEGRVEIRRTGWVVLCEGNFDLLALHQHGFSNSVAPMGTALTLDQAKLLKRYAEQAVLLFDGDQAGRKAVRAAFPIMMKAGLAAKVVALPPGDDPDTFLRRDGADALRTRIDGAPGIVEFLIDDAAQHARGAGSKATAIAELGPILIRVDNPVERRIYLERVARKFGIGDIEAVKDQLRAGVRSDRGQRSRSAQDAEIATKSPRPQRLKIHPLVAEILTALLDHPQLFCTPMAKKFGELLTSADLRAMFETVSRMVAEQGRVEAIALLEQLEGNPGVGWLEERLAQQVYDEGGARTVLEEGVPRLALQWTQAQVRALSDRIVEAYRVGDHSLATELTREREALLSATRK